jgi:diacylglycerol kinase family enzyme
VTENHEPEPSYRLPAGEVAVLLNANAGRVKRSTVRAIRSALPEATVFWTRSMEEAEDAVEAAIESGIETIFAGGGDGTLIDLANRLLPYQHAPRLGILKLGTGNALATWVGARPVPEDLRAWRAGEAFREKQLRMVRAGDDFFPFAGMGWDAAVLNDYRWAKQHLKGTPFEAKPYQLPTYLAAAFGRTVPRYATNRAAPHVTIEVLTGEAWRIDRIGSRIGPVLGPGEILYRGPAHMTAFGSTPYYGYAMRILPHACMTPSHFHLRVSALSIVTAINQLPKIWVGDFEDERLYDFLVESVYVSYDQEVPYQVGGDARGMKQDLVLDLSPVSVPVVSFKEPTPVDG